MKKKFILFLKKKGIYTSYRKLVIPNVRNEIENGHIPHNIINYSFSWESTKEGYEFWRFMANDWANSWFYYYWLC